MNELIYSLLESKAYSELTNNELKMVSEHLTSEDYEIARLDILALKEVIDNEINEIEVDNSILLHLNENLNKKLGIFSRFLSAKVSLFKVAAIFIFVIFGYTLILLNLTEGNNSNGTIVKSTIDTIFQTKFITSIDTVFILKGEKQIVKPIITEGKSEIIATNSINQKDKPNLKNAYANQALAKIRDSKLSPNRGISSKHEYYSELLPEPIVDQFGCCNFEYKHL